MIGQQEISRLARAAGVGDKAQEKDYVLTVLLAAHASSPGSGLVFKGGTALRRCYFEEYRYSEDLDFTADGNPGKDELEKRITAWFDGAQRTWGVKCSWAKALVESANGFVGYAGYVAVLKGGADEREIKIDISLNEAERDGSVERRLLSPYSDVSAMEHKVTAYSLGEIWAEKTRSLLQRVEPRDLYDLLSLSDRDGAIAGSALDLFKRKAKSKGKDPATLAARLDGAESTFRRSWEKRLQHQIRDLPEFEEAWRRVKRALREAGYL